MRLCFITTLTTLILTAFSFVPNFTYAQTLPCGNIITPANYYYEGQTEEYDVIQDCTNPFARTGDLTTLKVNNQIVTNNATYTVSASGTSDYGFTGETYNNKSDANYYLHSGLDYIRVNINFAQPTEAEYEAEITNFFNGNQIQTDLYTTIIHTPNQNDYFIVSFSPRVYKYDPVEPSKRVVDVYNEMEQYIRKNAKSPRPALLPGTYTVTLVDTDEGPNPTYQPNTIQKLFATLIPTANAYYNVNTVTFTLAGPAPAPIGASSVLFLPGIQASRLYTTGLLGSENQIWEPNVNADVEKLAMTTNGVSGSDVYTRDIIDELALPAAGTNVYKGFISFMDDLVINKKIINAWKPFAYDWRYDVDTIAKNGTQYQNGIKSLVAEVEQLATSSFTGKVTIIGHSNGGLLGKMLISELERVGKANLIDKLVMIGTPQLGAPKAALVMLHGYDQQAVSGLVISDSTARDVIRNMQGTYGLLPSAEYFAKSNDTMISTDNSNTTASVTAYGPINSETSLRNFALDSLSQRNDIVPINEPSTLNAFLYENSRSTKNKLDSWLPPAGVKVYEVVGTGNPTIKSIKYQSFPCRFGTLTCVTGSYMKAVPTFTDSGDETVPVISANGQDGEKVTGFVDLFKDVTFLSPFPKKHFNITESSVVQTFIESIVKFPYLADSIAVPNFTQVTRSFKVVGVHSPVSIKITDKLGRQTGLINGSSKEDIPGSEYYELGDSKYIIIPDDVTFTADMTGEATGLYSLTIDTLKNNTQTNDYRYIGASTTPTMKASFAFATSGFSNIKTDLNGDNIVDLEQTLHGQVIIPPTIPKYQLLKNNIKSLKLSKLLEIVLTAQVDLASYWDTLRPYKPAYQQLEFAALDSLKATLAIYKQKKIITAEQYVALEVIINYLRK